MLSTLEIVLVKTGVLEVGVDGGLRCLSSSRKERGSRRDHLKVEENGGYRVTGRQYGERQQDPEG